MRVQDFGAVSRHKMRARCCVCVTHTVTTSHTVTTPHTHIHNIAHSHNTPHTHTLPQYCRSHDIDVLWMCVWGVNVCVIQTHHLIWSTRMSSFGGVAACGVAGCDVVVRGVAGCGVAGCDVVVHGVAGCDVVVRALLGTRLWDCELVVIPTTLN